MGSNRGSEAGKNSGKTRAPHEVVSGLSGHLSSTGSSRRAKAIAKSNEKLEHKF